MVDKVYSKVQSDCLLFSVVKMENIGRDRVDLSPEQEPLQVACKKINSGVKFKAHKHNPLHRQTEITQEAWVFLRGKVKAKFYDLDDSLIDERILQAGDCAVVFRAGHAFEVLEDDTLLYEFKNGPYFGVEKDKTFLDEDKSV